MDRKLPASRQIEGDGRTRIAGAFEQAFRQKSAALMPYFTLGYPDNELSLSIIEAIAPYSDLIELGIPFSDPIADGPTIQRSTQQALEGGTTPKICLELLAELRQRGIKTPVLLLGYYNSILSYGEKKFARDASLAGADGLIVPDLPPEEANVLQTAITDEGLSYIPFLAPTSSRERIGLVAKNPSGFIYMVSVIGITGARATLSDELPSFINELRRSSSIPIAVGFGISTPQQAARVGSFADGVIVGSALINAVNGAEDKIRAAVTFVRSLNQALTI
jgi:tryptophan synthase alpha chain